LAKINKVVPGVRMCINVSARQMFDEDFISELMKTVRDEAIDASQIELELTESLLIHDLYIADRWVNQLREHGFRVAIDDFGTGYSSMSYLSRFSFDVIKLDRAFITQSVNSTKDREIMQSIIHLAEKLNCDVVAEGIEDYEQFTLLKRTGCRLGQGYLIEKPLQFDELMTALDLYKKTSCWPSLVPFVTNQPYATAAAGHEDE
jgi:EAL domain-containing protein (putative c-di-GMP-specific phosphodiesterase class I)